MLHTRLASWSDSGYTPSLYGLTLTGNSGQQQPTPTPYTSLQNQHSAAFLGTVHDALLVAGISICA
jgi:hypothetical protein